jgi:hypothetical protein
VIKAHARLKEKGIVAGKVTLDSKLHAGPNDQILVAFGRKPSDKNPTGLQGFHEKYILVIIDECAGVPAELWEAAESLASKQGRCDLGGRKSNRSELSFRRSLQTGIWPGGPADQRQRHPRLHGRTSTGRHTREPRRSVMGRGPEARRRQRSSLRRSCSRRVSEGLE